MSQLDRELQQVDTIYTLIGVVVIVAVIYFLIRVAIRLSVKEAGGGTRRQGGRVEHFHVPAAIASQPSGPGTYRIQGVDRETRMDVTEFIEAASAENAKAKAELNGIVVTGVTLAR